MKIEEHAIFFNHIDSLKELSKDTSTKPIQFMTELQTQAINFDMVKRDYANQLNLSEETANSCDGLISISNFCVLIEFKNGKIKPAEVKTKLRDSLLIYCDITKQTISQTRDFLEFILVYNPQNNPDKNHNSSNSSSRIVIANTIAKKAKTELIRFDLERFQKLYVKAVHTYTPQEFEEFILSNIN